MTEQELVAALTRQPFMAFRVHLATGETLSVLSPGAAHVLSDSLLVLRNPEVGGPRAEGYRLVANADIERIEVLPLVKPPSGTAVMHAWAALTGVGYAWAGLFTAIAALGLLTTPMRGLADEPGYEMTFLRWGCVANAQRKAQPILDPSLPWRGDSTSLLPWKIRAASEFSVRSAASGRLPSIAGHANCGTCAAWSAPRAGASSRGSLTSSSTTDYDSAPNCTGTRDTESVGVR